ncbi:MAG: phosphoglycerate mutase family protein [Pseudomonadota bacterium]|nr:phosphoglycerate mutase family protein [Pseudomonadota bacterium]
MQLILVRHGEAERMTVQDSERHLTERGEQQASWTAQQVLARYQPDHLVVSPLRRAQQTMQAFASRSLDVPVTVLSCIQPDDPAAPALNALAELQGKCILVVCHMNIIAQLAALLLDDRPEGFDLAEARVFEQPVVVPALSIEQWRCVPPYFSE